MLTWTICESSRGWFQVTINLKGYVGISCKNLVKYRQNWKFMTKFPCNKFRTKLVIFSKFSSQKRVRRTKGGELVGAGFELCLDNLSRYIYFILFLFARSILIFCVWICLYHYFNYYNFNFTGNLYLLCYTITLNWSWKFETHHVSGSKIKMVDSLMTFKRYISS